MDGFAKELARLAKAADKIGRPALPRADEIDEDSDMIAMLLQKGQQQNKKRRG